MPKRSAPIVPTSAAASSQHLSAAAKRRKKKAAQDVARANAPDKASADLAAAVAAFNEMGPDDEEAEEEEEGDDGNDCEGETGRIVSDDNVALARVLTGPGHEGLLSLVHEAESGGASPASSGRKIASASDASDKPERFFAWLVAPLNAERFWGELHERRPFHVSRPQSRDYYSGWFGRSHVEKLLKAGKLRYTEELDITSYTDGVRATHNGQGVAAAADVWSAFARGCSVRLSWPQRHSDGVWAMIAQLEEHLGCGGGCNAYLTPKGTQGFAPHYDDVDAYVLQVEGSKLWPCSSQLYLTQPCLLRE